MAERAVRRTADNEELFDMTASPPPEGNAKATRFIDNDSVIVTEWRFAPGANTGWHRHGHDYVVVPLGDGKLRLVNPGGVTAEADLKHGVPYYRAAGVEHDVINGNDYEFAFIEIEIKKK